jgi:hypothetical protein
MAVLLFGPVPPKGGRAGPRRVRVRVKRVSVRVRVRVRLN